MLVEGDHLIISSRDLVPIILKVCAGCVRSLEVIAIWEGGDLENEVGGAHGESEETFMLPLCIRLLIHVSISPHSSGFSL
jgi:hypothetical protein